MKNKIYLIIMCCAILLFCSCKDEDLLIEKIPYVGNELRIDGYYYKQETDKTFVRIFYRNGVMIDFISSFSTTNLSVVDDDIIEMYERWRNYKLVWEVFLINKNNIQWSGWSTSVGGGLPSFKCIGTIENDTTFRIIKSINSDGREFERDDIYHFRQFSPKPDSTNVFIK